MRKNIFNKKKTLLPLILALSLPLTASARIVNESGNYTNTGELNNGNLYGYTVNGSGSAGAGSVVYVGGNFTGDIDYSRLAYNSAGTDGGAVYVNNNFTGDIGNSSLNNNSAGLSGGAVHVGGNFTGLITGDSHFIENTAGQSGGAFYVGGDYIGGIIRARFVENTAGQSGGAFYISGDFNGDIKYIGFKGNIAGQDGGAFYVGGDFNSTIIDSVFARNSATNGYGGAIYLRGDTGANVNMSLDGNNLFQGNMAQNEPNSIHFQNAGSSSILTVTGGIQRMLDPIFSADNSGSGGGLTTINQTGGTWYLGGPNVTNGSAWNITGGTLVAGAGSGNNAFSIYYTTHTFTIGPNATFGIAPTGLTASISTSGAGNTITLNGAVGLASDSYASAAELQTGTGVVLLNVEANSGTLNNAQNLLATEGTVSIGLRQVSYSNLHWFANSATNHNLIADIYNSNEPSALAKSGTNASQAADFMNMHDPTSDIIFAGLGNFTATGSNKNLTNTKSGRNLWAHAIVGRTTKDAQDGYEKATMTNSGLILGATLTEGDTSLFGAALSYSVPRYKQGGTTTAAKDIRAIIYGAKEFDSGLQLDWLASAGIGRLDTMRNDGFFEYQSRPLIRHYSLGLKLSKELGIGEKDTLKPFLSLEYLNSRVEGYTETGVMLGGAFKVGSAQKNTYRSRLGLEYIHNYDNGAFKAGLYYQHLFGETEMTNHISMEADPVGLHVTSKGADKNAGGIYLNYNRKMDAKTSIGVNYSGLKGSKAFSNAFGVQFTYKF